MQTITFPPPSPQNVSETQKIPKVVKERQKLDDLVKNTQDVIYKTQNVFPFDFFPDTIVIDKNKVQIVFGMFFGTNEIFTILLDHLHSVTVDHDLFFASINFEVTGYENNPNPVKFLRIKDALEIRRIINGLIACRDEKVDLNPLSVGELRAKLEEIGRTREAEPS